MLNVDPLNLKPINIVIERSKKTGDYAVLSAPDISILALTLQLHEQHSSKLQQDKVINQFHLAPVAAY